VQGTVPYLGTFLTDLMMIDAAFRDTTDGGLINFDKRRREFEVLTQIKLFQSAASMYHIVPDRQFADWFDRLQAFDDNERSVLSSTPSTCLNERVTEQCLTSHSLGGDTGTDSTATAMRLLTTTGQSNLI